MTESPHTTDQTDADAAMAARLRGFFDRPGFLVRRAHQVVVASFIDRMGPVRLTPTQFAALVVVCDQPAIDQITLSRRLGIDRTNTSMVVNGLTANGWLHSTRDPQDGRRNLLIATRAGEASMVLARDIAIAHGAHLASLMPDGELARLCDMLRGLLTRLHARGPEWQRPDGGRDLFDLSGLMPDFAGHAALYGAIGFLMRRAQQAVEAVFLDEIGIPGMTPRRAGLLYVTDITAPVEQLTLARWLALDNSTMASVVGDLVKKGLIARRTHPSDKRRRLLSLSAEGSRVLDRQSHGAERASSITRDALGAQSDDFIALMQRFLLVTQELNRVPLHPAVTAQNQRLYGS